MQEQNYTGMTGTNQQTGGNGIVHFLVGLFTGAAVAAPVTALVVKKIGDKKKEKEVQRAYLEGENRGIQAATEQAQQWILQNGVQTPQNASKTASKAPRSSSGISDGQDIKDEATEASEGQIEGFSVDLLEHLVEQDLRKSGMSEQYICMVIDEEEGRPIRESLIQAKAVELKKQMMQKLAEGKMDIPGEVPKDLDDIVSDKKPEIVKEQGSVISDSNDLEVVVEQPDGSFTYYEPSGNPYLSGTIEDPEARKRFERIMAENESPSEDDINDYDLTIDDEEATQEAREFSESHAQYIEMLNKYKNLNGDIPPMTISREMFENEHYLEKAHINWYEQDDVFEENDRRIEDPYYNFGFVTGRDMFAPARTDNREDPDICYVRNLKLSTDFEIARIHGSYAQLIEDGEAYYRGDTNS